MSLNPDAYHAADDDVAGLHLGRDRGERVIGFKLTFDSSDYEALTQRMQLEDGGTLALESAPRSKLPSEIEPGIAFILARELRGHITTAQALDACSGVCAAMEIRESPSHSNAFVLGRAILPPTVADWSRLAMTLESDGSDWPSDRFMGVTLELSGDPLQAIVRLCALLDERGHSLLPGSVVLAGAPARALPLDSGMRVRLRAGNLGEISLRVSDRT